MTPRKAFRKGVARTLDRAAGRLEKGRAFRVARKRETLQKLREEQSPLGWSGYAELMKQELASEEKALEQPSRLAGAFRRTAQRVRGEPAPPAFPKLFPKVRGRMLSAKATRLEARSREANAEAINKAAARLADSRRDLEVIRRAAKEAEGKAAVLKSALSRLPVEQHHHAGSYKADLKALEAEASNFRKTERALLSEAGKLEAYKSSLESPARVALLRHKAKALNPGTK